MEFMTLEKLLEMKKTERWFQTETFDGEKWEDIAGLEGLYQISNLGRVKGLPREWLCAYHGKSLRKAPERILRPTINGKGYENLGLNNAKKERKMYRVHQMVAKTFVLNPQNLPQVNHKNGNKIDNRVENLEWTTNLENMRHAWKNGLKNANHTRGSKNPNTKLTEETVKEIKDVLKNRSDKFGDRTIAKMFNVSRNIVTQIRRGNTWKHVT